MAVSLLLRFVARLRESREEIHISPGEICISSRETCISLFDLYISLADLCISPREICISGRELHKWGGESDGVWQEWWQRLPRFAKAGTGLEREVSR